MSERLAEISAGRPAFTCPELLALVRKRWQYPAYAVFPEIRDAGGHSASRQIDAVVFGLYPSRGHEITLIEIKASRADWLRELKQPEKLDAFKDHGDTFYLVANKGVVDLGKDPIPSYWGLLEPDRGSLREIRRPPSPARGRGRADRPMSRGFVASLLKRHSVGITAEERSEIEREIRNKLRGENEIKVGVYLTRLKRLSENVRNLDRDLDREIRKTETEVRSINHTNIGEIHLNGDISDAKLIDLVGAHTLR